MEKKSIFAICICGILVTIMIFGAYQFGLSNGYSKGSIYGFNMAKQQINAPRGPSGTWVDGYNAGNASGYQLGYQAGLRIAQSSNGTG